MLLYGVATAAILCFLIEETLSQAAVGVSIQNVIGLAVQDYRDENYEDSIKGFETGLVHWRMLKHIDITCGLRCISPNISKEIKMNMDGFDDLVSYGNMLAQANCMKICKEEHPFTKSKIERPSDAFIADFDKREPYDYLQFAYFKTGRVKKACQAAHTYHQINPHNEQMRENIAYYKGLDEVSDDYFKDLEGNPYKEQFRNGVKLYENQKYGDAIVSFEKALLDYIKVHDECKALCYVANPPVFFYRFPQAIVTRYIPVLECTLKCDDKLRPLVGNDLLENFVARTFAYLQFSYYQIGKWEMAVPAAASALLLNPEDEMSVTNLKYYKENAAEHGLKPEIHFQPCLEAVKHHLERKTSENLLALMHKAVDIDDEEEVEEDEEEDFLQEEFMREITKQVTLQLGERLRGDTG